MCSLREKERGDIKNIHCKLKAGRKNLQDNGMTQKNMADKKQKRNRWKSKYDASKNFNIFFQNPAAITIKNTFAAFSKYF